MALTRNQKKLIIDRLAGITSSARTMVFVRFKGLSVADTTNLRSKLREQETGYTVAKKSLLRQALGAQGILGEEPALEGEIAVAYGPDEVIPAKEIETFAKKHAEQISIVGGILNGHYLSADEMKALALVPGKQVLYGQIVSVLAGPMRNMAGVLQANIRNLLGALDQIAQKKAA